MIFAMYETQYSWAWVFSNWNRIKYYELSMGQNKIENNKKRWSHKIKMRKKLKSTHECGEEFKQNVHKLLPTCDNHSEQKQWWRWETAVNKKIRQHTRNGQVIKQSTKYNGGAVTTTNRRVIKFIHLSVLWSGNFYSRPHTTFHTVY